MRVALPFFCVLLSLSLYGQDTTKGNWVLSMNLGIQKHDKRLFGLLSRGTLLESQPGFLGTYQFGVSFSKLRKLKRRYEISYGIGLSTEISTFRRPYDHKYRINFGNDAIRYTNRYYKFLISSPIKLLYQKSSRLSFLIEVLPQVNTYTVANNTTAKYRDINKWFEIGLYSVELNPGISYDLEGMQVEAKIRLFQVKKIDRIIFNYLLHDDRDATYECYNPIKLWFSINRKF